MVLNKLPKPFLVLAPMDDVTDSVFRQIIADCAKPDLFFTEFVNVDGLQSPGRPRLLHKLLLSEKEKPVIVQLWGLKPENYYKTTIELIEMGFAGVDVNMGCPVKTQAKEMASKYKLDGVMVGRGIFDDPFLSAEQSPWANWTPQQKIALFKKHIELHLKTYKNGERRFETLRKFCKVYINGFEGAA